MTELFDDAGVSELERRIGAWLDTARGSNPVIEAVDRFYGRDYANIHRGIYLLSERATAAYEGVRDRVRRFINAAEASEIVFTRGTTEAINLVAQSFARRRLDRLGCQNPVLYSRICKSPRIHANLSGTNSRRLGKY